MSNEIGIVRCSLPVPPPMLLRAGAVSHGARDAELPLIPPSALSACRGDRDCTSLAVRAALVYSCEGLEACEARRDDDARYICKRVVDG